MIRGDVTRHKRLPPSWYDQLGRLNMDVGPGPERGRKVGRDGQEVGQVVGM